MRLLKIFWGLWGVVSVDSFIGSTAPVTGLRRLSLGTGGGPGAAAVRRGRSSSEVRMAAAIVGRGRIGSALYALEDHECLTGGDELISIDPVPPETPQEMGGGDDVMIGRTDPIPEGEGPIYVCTRNDDLGDVISRTPESRKEDLVFIQNGVLGPLLETHGLASNTQALIYFAVTKKGEAPIDGVTDVNPEGLTSTCGKWAEELKARLTRGGLSCHVLPEASYTAKMYEKLIWICTFMLSGTAHECTIGEVEREHNEEVRTLIQELQTAIEGEYGVTFEPGVQERLCAYARSVAHYPAAIKEFRWRNGFFWEISKKATKAGNADPCPMHSKMLREASAERGLGLPL